MEDAANRNEKNNSDDDDDDDDDEEAVDMEAFEESGMLETDQVMHPAHVSKENSVNNSVLP